MIAMQRLESWDENPNNPKAKLPYIRGCQIDHDDIEMGVVLGQ